MNFWQSGHYDILANIAMETVENLSTIHGSCLFQRHRRFMILGQTEKFVEAADSKPAYFDASYVLVMILINPSSASLLEIVFWKKA